MIRTTLYLLLLLACLPAFAQERAPIRFDNWLYFQHNTDDSDRWQYRPRFYIPFALANGGTFTQRIDLPMYYTNRRGTDNPGGDWKSGIGDWFVEEIYLSPEFARNTKWSSSLRLVFPTGGDSPFGSQQYQWAPSVGVSHAMPEQKLTFYPLARYFMSYHANTGGAGQIRRLDLYPAVTKGFDDGWSLALWPENAISYNQVSKKWFVPIDAMVIKRMGKSWEWGFGGAYAIEKDDPQYQYIVNGRVTFFF